MTINLWARKKKQYCVLLSRHIYCLPIFLSKEMVICNHCSQLLLQAFKQTIKHIWSIKQEHRKIQADTTFSSCCASPKCCPGHQGSMPHPSPPSSPPPCLVAALPTSLWWPFPRLQLVPYGGWLFSLRTS